MYALADIEATPETAIPEILFEALCDDLNTPKALAALNALAKEAAEKRTPILKAQLLTAGQLLGILKQDPAAWLGYGQAEEGIDQKQIEKLLAERTAAKAAKNFARADEIRAELSTLGIAIEDTPQGPKWKKAG